MTIYNLTDDKKITPFEKTPVLKEQEIEDFIEQNPQILDKDLFIISRQQRTSDNKIPDLIGFNNTNGNVVIIELKKGNAARKVISQILDYAVWAENMKYKDPDIYHKLQEKFKNQKDNDPSAEFNQHQELYVIGEEIDPRTEELTRYLHDKGIHISCIEINFHKSDGRTIVDKKIITDKPVGNSRPLSTEDEHLKKGDETVCGLYRLLRPKIMKLGNDITVKANQSYIGFVRHGKNFAVVKIKNDSIRLELQTRTGFDDPKDLTRPFHKRKNLRYVEFREEKQLSDIMDLVGQTYDHI